jgi:hypothetical protein
VLGLAIRRDRGASDETEVVFGIAGFGDDRGPTIYSRVESAVHVDGRERNGADSVTVAKHVLCHGGALSKTRGDKESDRTLFEQVRRPVHDPGFGTRVSDAIEAESRLEHLGNRSGIAYPQLEVIEAGEQTCRRLSRRTDREIGFRESHVTNSSVDLPSESIPYDFGEQSV